MFCAAAQAQPQSHHPAGRPSGGPGPQGPVPRQSIRERWLALPPEARQNFRRNAEIWMRMSPEQRNLMRQRENLRREVLKQESERALRESGLHLNPQERAQFESRYVQERQKVERALRQQIETERQKELPALIQQLKKEFQIDQPTKAKPESQKPESQEHSQQPEPQKPGKK
ncbi:MAG: hypothetical protein DME33_09465 [Verrucomicrobia bacterium]|nr:MAG: hypothetical protein DME33_09465 [Verrucomicrobiota bacterium]